MTRLQRSLSSSPTFPALTGWANVWHGSDACTESGRTEARPYIRSDKRPGIRPDKGDDTGPDMSGCPTSFRERSGAEGGGGGEGSVEAEVGAVEEGGEFGEAKGEAFGGGGAEGDMAEFAARAREFAIEMEVGVGEGKDFRRIGELADQIEHRAVTGRSCGAEG